MQTFLPFPSYAQSASALDRQRLGKQRVECLQILRALTNPDYGWQTHTAVRMWRGYECALRRYAFAICDEWTARGYADTCREKIAAMDLPAASAPFLFPHWLGNPALHASHKSNLIRKLPSHYAPLFPGVTPDLPYYWPEGLF